MKKIFAVLSLLVSVALGQGATLSGTFSGNPIFTGNVTAGTFTTTSPAITPTSIEAVEYADQFPGADIGAKINAAIGALPSATGQIGCGTVVVPAGLYMFAVTIIKPRCVVLEGNAANGTILVWTPTSGVAIAVGDQNSQYTGSGGGITPYTNTYPPGGLQNIVLAGSGGTAVGVWYGGDPAGVILPSADWGDSQTNINLVINVFGVGEEWGNNSPYVDCYSCSLFKNSTGLYSAPSSNNSNETNRFYGGKINYSSAYGVNGSNGNVDWQFFGTSFDFNGIAFYTAPVSCIGCHLEQVSGEFIHEQTSGSARIDLVNSGLFSDATTGTDTDMISGGGEYSQLDIVGGLIVANHTVTNVVAWTTGLAQWLNWNGTRIETTGGIISATPATFIGAINEETQGGTALNVNGGSVAYSAAPPQLVISSSGSSVNACTESTVPDVTAWDQCATTSGILQIDNSQASGSAVLQLTNTSMGWSGALAWGGGSTIPSSSAVALVLSATTSTITPGSIAANSCYVSSAQAVAGATTAMTAVASPAAALGTGFTWSTWVSSAGYVAFQICNATTGALTPTATTWNIRVIQ